MPCFLPSITLVPSWWFYSCRIPSWLIRMSNLFKQTSFVIFLWLSYLAVFMWLNGKNVIKFLRHGTVPTFRSALDWLSLSSCLAGIWANYIIIWSNLAAGFRCVHTVFLPLKHLVTALLPFLGGWRGAAWCSWIWHRLWKWTHQPQRTNTQQGVQTDRETTQTLPHHDHRLVWTKTSVGKQSVWVCLWNISWCLSSKGNCSSCSAVFSVLKKRVRFRLHRPFSVVCWNLF